MLPSTTERVPRHTADAVNLKIERELEYRLAYFTSRPDEIGKRLLDLDHEWDIERTLEANASILAFFGVVLGARMDRRWLALPAAVSAFLFQHATQGWCPPVPILRRLGFRTSHEIELERHALKALRGDYKGIRQADDRAAAAVQSAKA